ncbi:hypothetical protein HZ326_1178 [Fusarium oxysporum f. sp. albedinis]|nr:hypothetical protein HZ326_1178 [Fusarium oxysporum f. sp. albedinis]
MRIPTSDVEDKFRVDPSQREPPWQTDVVVASDYTPFLDGLACNESLYMSDFWFNTPLFASSGYQQFCQDVDHV